MPVASFLDFGGSVLDKVNKYAPAINAGVAIAGVGHSVYQGRKLEKRQRKQDKVLAASEAEANAQAEGTRRQSAYAYGSGRTAYGIYSSFHKSRSNRKTGL